MSRSSPLAIATLGLGLGLTSAIIFSRSSRASKREGGPSHLPNVKGSARVTILYSKAYAEGTGMALPLSMDDIRNRALFLIGERKLSELDRWIDTSDQTLAAWNYGSKHDYCLPLYYQLHYPINGGGNPKSPDPATRWHLEGKTAIHRTCDCTGATSWMLGQHRRQNWAGKWGKDVNVDVRILDALSTNPQGYERLPDPLPGCIIAFPSKSGGHQYGHEGIVTSVPARWDSSDIKSWGELIVANVASLGAQRCNVKVSGKWWWPSWVDGKRTYFLKSIVKPTAQ